VCACVAAARRFGGTPATWAMRAGIEVRPWRAWTMRHRALRRSPRSRPRPLSKGARCSQDHPNVLLRSLDKLYLPTAVLRQGAFQNFLRRRQHRFFGGSTKAHVASPYRTASPPTVWEMASRGRSTSLGLSILSAHALTSRASTLRVSLCAASSRRLRRLRPPLDPGSRQNVGEIGDRSYPDFDRRSCRRSRAARLGGRDTCIPRDAHER
jgi:hypothetical protein